VTLDPAPGPTLDKTNSPNGVALPVTPFSSVVRPPPPDYPESLVANPQSLTPRSLPTPAFH